MANLFTTYKTTVRTNDWIPFPALQNARETASAHKGEIGTTDKGFFKATFATAEIAKKVASKLNADYAAHAKHPVSAPAPAKGKGTDTVTVVFNGVEYKVKQSDLVPTTSSTKKNATKKPSTKKPTASTKAPRKTKGNSVTFDFGKIKGKTNTDKNKALHAELVRMGMKDSRTPEYMSVWNARPWAK